MPEYTPKPGTFSLFAVREKKSEKGPDYTGNGVLLDGTAVQISGWKRTSKSGTTYLSCTIGPPYKPQAEQPQQQQRPLTQFAPEDDVPF